MEVLFDTLGNHLEESLIRKNIENFRKSYSQVVSWVIENSEKLLDEAVFCENIATLIPSFKMTRKGPFEGVRMGAEGLEDRKGIVAGSWKHVGEDAVALKELLIRQNKSRARVLVEIGRPLQEEVARRLWDMFKKVVPLCMGKHTYGLVGASKILFAVLPEVALPVDNSQWLNVFRTIDYGDIVLAMAAEIAKWEERSGGRLNDCSPHESFTLPAVYNVMAMKARPARHS